jgi:2-oxoglutarate ferredoxin oxidoreductase subunit alpha
MARPGTPGGIYQTNGLEHDESGRPSSGYLLHERMNAKRYRKLRPIRDAYRFHRHYGPRDAEIGILCWGSSKGAVREAVRRAGERGQKVAAFVPQVLYPFPKKEFEDFLRGLKRVLVVELSYSAQFYKYLRTFLDLPEARTHIYKRSGGKSLTVAELDAEIAALFAAEHGREEVVA